MAKIPAVALLAPVPLVHLVSGAEVCREQGRVAFGTRAWEVFHQLVDQAGPDAPVLIYASHAEQSVGSVVSWTARFVRWVEAVGGRHPDEDLYRPTSTQVGREDDSGYWHGFWEVTDLRHLQPEEQLPINRLKGTNGRGFARDFIPEGPTLLTTDGGVGRTPH